MRKRPPKKEAEDLSDILDILNIDAPEIENTEQVLKKAETWVYSEPARRLDEMLRRKGKLEETDFSNEDFGGMNLSGKILKGINFKNSYLGYVSFEKSDLERADFQDADLRYANLKNAVLIGANFKGANLEHADLTGAVLTDADFDGTTLVKNAKLPVARPEELKKLVTLLEEIEAGEVDIHALPKRYLRYVNLRSMDLTGLDLRGVDMDSLNLSGVNLSGVIFDARKELKMEAAENHLKMVLAQRKARYQQKIRRPLFKRNYEFPPIFDEEGVKSKVKPASKAEDFEQPQVRTIGPRMRVRKRIRVKT